MNFQSPRAGSSYIINQPSRISQSRVFSNKQSLENIPIQFIQQQQSNRPSSTKIDSSKNKYSIMQQMKGSTCFATPRSALSSVSPLDFLKNIDSKRNSLSQQNQPQFVKVQEIKGHQKNHSYASPLQSQTFLSKSPSTQSVVGKNFESQQDISEVFIQSNQKENIVHSDQLSKAQQKQKELMKQVEILQNKLLEQQAIQEQQQSNINILQSTLDSKAANIELLKTKSDQFQYELDNLKTMLSEKDVLIFQLMNREKNSYSEENETYEAVKNERDQLKKSMQDIFVNIEKVLQENQQLNQKVQEINKYKQIANITQNQIASKDEEIESLKKEISMLEGKHFNSYKAISDENLKLMKEIEELQSSFSLQNQTKTEEANRNQKLVIQQNEHLEQQLQAIKNEKKQLELNSEKLLDQNENLYQKVRLLNEKISILNEYMRKLEIENQQLQVQTREQEKTKDNELHKQVDDLEIRILDLVKENENLGFLLEQQSNLIQQQSQSDLQQQLSYCKSDNERIKNESSFQSFTFSPQKKILQ